MKNWENAKLVFKELNDNYCYLILRNYEDFYTSILSDKHADIDILCKRKDKKKIIKLLEAKPRLNKNDGIHYYILIQNERIPIDMRWDGDGYYDQKWELAMLNNRIFDERGFYCMAYQDYYWSLLYHALYQKGHLSQEYYDRLKNIESKIFEFPILDLELELAKFMMERKYFYTTSKDKYLWYHFTDICKGHIKYNPEYKLRMFLCKCREFILNHCDKRKKNASK